MRIIPMAALLLCLTLAACATPATPGATVAPIATSPPAPAATPAGAAPAGDLTIMFSRSGGIAGVNQSYILMPDGSVTMIGSASKSAGAPAAAALASQIAATGIYAVAPDKYMPASPCCDRFTYNLALSVGGKSYNYVTMDGSETAPPALSRTISLISQYIAAAK